MALLLGILTILFFGSYDAALAEDPCLLCASQADVKPSSQLIELSNTVLAQIRASDEEKLIDQYLERQKKDSEGDVGMGTSGWVDSEKPQWLVQNHSKSQHLDRFNFSRLFA